ncbi:glutamate-rich protein 6 [Scomber japonicus]|uniref:glutamate-rich protein 6 n=1 Tax=Scomber japonicus TaxID=13676 RepID=UPI0023054839|nr:glutamate-rich protein 6 [Scomber japonicus]
MTTGQTPSADDTPEQRLNGLLGASATSLDLSEPLCVLDDHALPLFCCAWREQLYKMLVKQRCLVEGRSDLGTSSRRTGEEKSNTELEELQGREMEDHNTFIVDLPSGLGCPDVKGPQLSALLCYRRQMLDSDDGGFLQKYYSNGMKFLTLFPDSSAQVFYPSGLLALVIVVTKESGKVCIVYDCHAPNQPIRAVFQSDGRATCYYSNGNIWLTLDRSGGQCLDETGGRVRRWSWSNLNLSPTPLLPVFLSLNKTVGVRVLGKEQVFVSFLAGGQQARFSVGACCSQCKCTSERPTAGKSILKEEVLVLAARIKIHMVIQHLHQSLTGHSHSQLLKTTLAPSLQVFARKLLKISANVMMSESDKAFIHKCLQDYV